MNLGSILPVGTIIHSMLTTTQFASEYGDNWVLADGRSVSGTKYALVTGLGTIPDMRDVFLRGKGNGRGINPDGDLSLGAYTADKYLSHTHAFQTNYNSGGGETTDRVLHSTASSLNLGPTIAPASGGNETAPKSVTVNIFIRIN